MTANYIQCGYVKTHTHERCTGEAVSDDPTVIRLCVRHLAMAMELVAEQKRRTTRRAER